MPELARPFGDIGDNVDVIEHDLFSVTGFPWEYQQTRNREQGFSSFTYRGLTPSPHGIGVDGLIRFDWCDEPYPAHSMGTEGGISMTTAPMHPGGMSGGALWRFRPIRGDDTRLWSPSGIGRLVEITRSWDKGTNTIAIEPVTRWGSWCRAKLNLIDSEGI